MKRTHIAAIILIAVALGVIISTISSSSTYESFTVASEKQGKVFHVVGKLNRSKPYEYHPETNANIFSFYMYDNQGVERKVILNRAKPQDFDKSEQIVIIGKMQDNQFLASDILLKCPSKYNSEKPVAQK
jgi:cytochrome c-type biogenesis protein CcmE